MDCSHDFALHDEELLRFALDDEPLPPETQAHLEQCEICRQRLALMRRLNSALVGRFYRRLCPSGTEISLYCEDLLPPDERMRIANHVLDCPLCAVEVADTRRFMRNTSFAPVTGSSPFAALRRVIGTLTRQQAQLVMRGEASSVPENAWPRQYRADGIDLSLHLTRSSAGEHVLIGILTSIDSEESVDMFEGARAELYSGSSITDIEQQTIPEPLRHTQVDDLGNLIFTAVPNGVYILCIHLPEQDVVIEQITIEQT